MRGIEERLGDLAWVLDLDRPLEPAARMDVLRRVADRLATTAVREGGELGPSSTRQVASPAWSAPEQIEHGHAPDARTDVWAMGLVALRTLTGRAFWRSDATDFHALAVEVTSAPIPSASERHPELRESGSSALDAWFARCVCRDRAARFAHPDLAIRHLASALPTASADGGSSEPSGEKVVPRRERLDRARSRALLFALGLLLALGAAALLFAIGFGAGARTRSAVAPRAHETAAPAPPPAMEPLRPRAEPVPGPGAREAAPVARAPEVLDPLDTPEAAPAPAGGPAGRARARDHRGHVDFLDPWADP